MAHAWNIIDGDIYVSKNGDDVAGDGSMANPYASLNKGFEIALLGNKIVVGTGLWQEDVAAINQKAAYLIGDGTVIFDGGGISFYQLKMHYSLVDETLFVGDTKYENINFTNYISSQAILIDMPYDNGEVRLHFINCTLSGYQIFGTSYRMINSTIFVINSQIIGTYFDNRFDSFFAIINSNIIDIPQTIFNDAKLAYNTNFINCKDGIYSIAVNGHSFNNYYNCLWWNGATSYIYSEMEVLRPERFIGCVGLDPKFNNEQIGDYTLKPDSPCLFAGKNNATIGAFGLGYSFDANSSEFTEEGGAVFSQTSSVNDIIRTSQVIDGITRFLFQLAAGHLSGNIESAWIDLQSIRYLLITRIFANLIYNSSGVATSRPDNLESTGEKAIYYDFELKYCNEESEKDTAAFKNVIWNKAVTIDDSDRGNANPDFVASEAKYISARFIKIKLYMTEA